MPGSFIAWRLCSQPARAGAVISSGVGRDGTQEGCRFEVLHERDKTKSCAQRVNLPGSFIRPVGFKLLFLTSRRSGQIHGNP